jgi:indolepyruvate ferredoxin oxidoreductase
MRQVVGRITPESAATALELARLPQSIRGFGHVKERNLAAAKRKEAELLAAFHADGTLTRAA